MRSSQSLSQSSIAFAWCPVCSKVLGAKSHGHCQHYGAKMLLRNVSGFRVCQSCRWILGRFILARLINPRRNCLAGQATREPEHDRWKRIRGSKGQSSLFSSAGFGIVDKDVSRCAQQTVVKSAPVSQRSVSLRVLPLYTQHGGTYSGAAMKSNASGSSTYRSLAQKRARVATRLRRLTAAISRYLRSAGYCSRFEL